MPSHGLTELLGILLTVKVKVRTFLPNLMHWVLPILRIDTVLVYKLLRSCYQDYTACPYRLGQARLAPIGIGRLGWPLSARAGSAGPYGLGQARLAPIG